jgi:MerR family mercuric resistance operon transcriptional regulator
MMAREEDTLPTGEGGLLIGELARESGVPAKTIRFYEEIGLLPPARRAANGYRRYDETDGQRLRFLRSARSLDFSLDDLRTVLALRDQGEAPCQHVLTLLAVKEQEIKTRIRELVALQQELAALQQQAATLPTNDMQMQHCICGLIRERL